MKTVTITKDAYIDNSVRINYFDKNATRKERRMKEFSSLGFSLSGEFPKPEDMFEEVEVVYDNLLFCERLIWTNEESELDEQIENKRLDFENGLNG
jgi:uncharacterized protein YggL (DUF469 family)